MSEGQVIADLEEAVGRPLEQDVVDALRGSGRLGDAEAGPRAFAQVVEYARDLQERLGGRSRRKSTSIGQDQPLFSEAEQRRATALCEYMAKCASALESVCAYRQQVLGGQLLTDECARRWILSDGVAQFPLALFVDQGVSPTENLGRFDEIFSEEGDAGPFERFTLRFEADGVEWEERRPMRPRSENLYLAYPGQSAATARVIVHRGSVLDDLRQVAQELAGSFPWEEHQATWFVLTGAIPLSWPIRRSVKLTFGPGFEYQALTFTIEPWVSAQTVLRTFRDAQRRMYRGRENRPLSPKSLELFRLWVSLIDDVGGTPRLHAVLKAWNDTHPNDRYESSQSLDRALKRTLEYVAYPNLDDPW